MENVKIQVDFNKKTERKIRPMHGVGQPPILRGEPGVTPRLFHYLKEAGIPYSRLHDVAGAYGGGVFVDIPNIFRDFDADVNDPASYDFAHTDILIRELYNYGVEPVYRLGITIENSANIRAFHVFPPKDFKKWAEICEHIIMHYNEGWADGFNYGITYWEIWNEPDVVFNPNNIAQTWHGTREEFFEFYKTAATHLKDRFGDSIQVGGYAAMGFGGFEQHDPEATGVIYPFSENDDPDDMNFKRAYRIDYCHKFLAFVRENKLPLDFFSWHCYTNIGPKMILACQKHCRKVLHHYGFDNVPDFLNEWNAERISVKNRSLTRTAANTFGVLLGSQRNEVAMLNYYDAGIGPSVYKGLFNPDTFYPYKTYYAFKSFNEAYKLGDEVKSESYNDDVYLLGARNDKKGVILIANTKDEPIELDLDVLGCDINSGEVLITDDEYLYTYVGDIIKDNKLMIKEFSMIEIRVSL